MSRPAGSPDTLVVGVLALQGDVREHLAMLRGLGEAMVGINVDEIPQPHRLAERGW